VNNNYLITRKIGHGAFGEVFIAKDLAKDINVAMKVERSTVKV